MRIAEPPCGTPYNPLFLLFRSAMTRFRRHAPEIRIQSGTEAKPAAPDRTYESARFIQRQRVDVTAEIVPDAVLLQVLLDVRKIERHNLPVVFPDVFPNRSYGFRS